MIYADRKYSTIIEIQKQKSISYSLIINTLKERPSNIIYLIQNNALWGIISFGDVLRAKTEGNSTVNVNCAFTKVFFQDHMKARQIFKNNSNISAIPVVDEKDQLMGEYLRWDDYLSLKNHVSYAELPTYVKNWFFSKSKIAVVCPCVDSEYNKEIFAQICKELMALKIEFITVSLEEVVNLDTNGLAIFVSENECRGARLLLNVLTESVQCKMCSFNELDISIRRIISEERTEISNELAREFGKEVGTKLFDNMIDSGIRVINLIVKNTESDYYKNFLSQIDNKFKMYNASKGLLTMPEEMYESFFDDLYTPEYAEKIMNLGWELEIVNDLYYMKDIKSQFLNIHNGERRVIGQPQNANNTIWFFGPCYIRGVLVDDEHTIESYLQMKLNSEGYNYKVVNKGEIDTVIPVLNKISRTEMRPGDIVICYINNIEFPNERIKKINLVESVEKNKVPATWVVDNLGHYNHKVSEIYSESILDAIKPWLSTNIQEVSNERVYLPHIVKFWSDLCVKKLDYDSKKMVGSIVMNCNPFTEGHMFLIKTALNYVDTLIIFVVEEDLSEFSFEERFNMVKENVKDYSNVYVIPSGKFILSQITFPEYFKKKMDVNIFHNIEHDIHLFGKWVVPAFGINYRFVGEEKEDEVTRSYNCAMKKILPDCGVEVIEIERKRNGGEVISASRVRTCINKQSNMWEHFVPKLTKDIIFRELI